MINKKSLLNRICYAVVIVLVMILIVVLALLSVEYYFCRIIDAFLISALIFLSVLEMRRALGKERIPDNFSWILYVYGIGLGLSYVLFGFTGVIFLTLFCFALATITAFRIGKAENLIYIAFCLVYPGLFMSSMLYLNNCASSHVIAESSPVYNYITNDIWTYWLGGRRNTQLLPYNALGLTFVFVVSSFTDVFAYFVGALLGKHKLCPDISPKKTVEGAIGGLFGGLIASLGVFLLFEVWHPFGMQFGLSIHGLSEVNMFVTYLAIGLVGSLMTQMGDLLASLVKRYCGIKDYSRLLGEHGGIVDRCDGMMLNATFVAIVYMFII